MISASSSSPLLHDGDEGHEQHGADDHGDERAEDEVVRRPIVEHARAPGADGMCGAGEYAACRAA